MTTTYVVAFYDHRAKRWRRKSGLTLREASTVARAYRAMGMDSFYEARS
jgi:hypothetical protein